MDLLNLSKEFLIILISITGGLILGLHIDCACIGGSFAKIGQGLNIFLHILLFALLLLSGAKIDVALLFFMSSVAFYTLGSYVRYQIEKGREKADNPLGGDAP